MTVHLTNFINVTELINQLVSLAFLAMFLGTSSRVILRKYKYFLFLSFSFLLWIDFDESAGCIVNDIVDEKIDKKVSRTK